MELLKTSQPENSSASEQVRAVSIVVIHGNGEAEAGWINPYVVDRFSAAVNEKGRPPELIFDSASLSYALVDDGGSPLQVDKLERKFPVHVRTGQFKDGPLVTFYEMNWADLSRMGNAPILQFLGGLKLLYEAPNVLSRAFLQNGHGLFHDLQRRFILLAIDTVRWFVAGASGAAIICSLLIGAINPIYEPLMQLIFGSLLTKGYLLSGDALHVCVAVLLFLGIFLSIHVAHLSEKGRWGITDISYSTAAFSFVGSIVSVFLIFSEFGRGFTQSDYLWFAISINFMLWLAWSIWMMLAGIMILALALYRMPHLNSIIRERERSRNPQAPTFGQISGALGLAALQGAFLKIFISVIGMLILSPRCPNCFDVSGDFVASVVSSGALPSLDYYRDNLIGIFVVNTVILLFCLAIAAILMFFPNILIKLGVAKSLVATIRPRLILHPIIVFVLVVLTIANALVVYGGIIRNFPGWFAAIEPSLSALGFLKVSGVCGGHTTIPFTPDWFCYQAIANSPSLIVVFVPVTVVIFILLALGVAQSFFGGIVHFVRDVVDHQYRPSMGTPRTVVNMRERLITWRNPAAKCEKWQAVAFPRRYHIQKRLDAVMTQLVVHRGDVDRLVLLAHSQGSVIIHDYLKEASHGLPGNLKETHVLTLGSPITQLYKRYFPEYRAVANITDGMHRVTSWTNLYRIDDPIGGSIELSGQRVVTHILGVGGHSDYWKEKDVNDVIKQLLTMPIKKSG